MAALTSRNSLELFHTKTVLWGVWTALWAGYAGVWGWTLAGSGETAWGEISILAMVVIFALGAVLPLVNPLP